MVVERSALGWGVALVAAGVVLLLRNLGAITASVSVWAPAMLAAGAVLLAHALLRGDLGQAALPAVLVVIGGLFLARDLGVLATVPLLPVALIMAGVAIIAAALPRDRLFGSRASAWPPERASEPLGGARQAHLTFRYGAGNLVLGDGAAPDQLFDGTFVAGVEQQINRSGDRVDLVLRHPQEVRRLTRSRRLLDWDVALAGDVPLDLEVQAGAARITLDLANVAARSVRVQTGASDVDVTLPSGRSSRLRISAGAADVRVHVPDGVAASIRNRSALAGVTVDTRRFPSVDGGFRSPEYDAAEHRAEIEIDGAVASFSVH